LKHEFPTCLTFIAIVVDKKLRYERVAKRPERPFDGKAIRERDRSEIENLEKGGPIAAADYYILNNGTIEDVQHATDRILKEIEF
jgi:dephospho-CoA kinase